MRIGLEAGAKPPVWEPKPREAAPEPNPPLSHISALHPRESCCCSSAPPILGAIGRDALEAVQCSAVVVLCEKAGKLRISAAHTLYK